MNTDAGVTIRTALPEDLERILELENECFLAPWSRTTLDYQIVNALSVFQLAEGEGRILGFSLAWTVDAEVHLLQLAVEEKSRRRGIGSALLLAGFEEFKKRGGKLVYLEVRRQNVGAVSFYKKFGFLPIGIRKRYYSDTGEDAIVLSLELP